MKQKLVITTLFVAFAVIIGMNVYNAQKPDMELSGLALANVEALADPETSDEFTQATCCEAVWENVSCRGCNGPLYSYAKRV
ncbi:NVEALA domain-containing protein [Phocaeicola sp.]|uniref:NVEALA domain-containing protein n=1 Tax=Phocaeicola sp. TaxID=2773926 RepID=UPI0023D47A2F|nr:NVEALA domain-containing protein [Phocaeicola sp.]MDE5677862.1 NVEALA domain-containing protein [Phocaeicola sp.]